jgi:hypothetical protein
MAASVAILAIPAVAVLEASIASIFDRPEMVSDCG